MKKFIIKLFLALSIFTTFGFSSFVMTKPRRVTIGQLRSKIRELRIGKSSEDIVGYRSNVVDRIVDRFKKEFDVTKYVQNNLLGYIDVFVKSVDLLQIFFKKSAGTVGRCLKLVENFRLDELAKLLGLNIDVCIKNILCECNEKIILGILNKPNENGITPLQLAANLGHWEMALELLRNGAYAFSVDSAGTIVDCALFDLNIFALNLNIPDKLIDEFKEYLIREIYYGAFTIDRAREILSRIPFLGNYDGRTSRASLYRRLFK